MIEGTAAKSSTAIPNGRRNLIGQISVRNNAIPKLSGVAMISAIKDETNVP